LTGRIIFARITTTAIGVQSIIPLNSFPSPAEAWAIRVNITVTISFDITVQVARVTLVIILVKGKPEVTSALAIIYSCVIRILAVAETSGVRHIYTTAEARSKGIGELGLCALTASVFAAIQCL